MKYFRADRFGRVLEVLLVELDPETGNWPPAPVGWTAEPWASMGLIEVGDWVRSGVYLPAASVQWADAVRIDRNAELVASDWTQTGDQVPARAALWAPYRQALRDVPQQTTFATEVVDWPVKPE